MAKPKGRGKGMRKGYLKRYSSAMVNTGMGPNAAVLAEYNNRVTSFRKPFHKKVEDIPETVGLSRMRAFGENSVPAAEVMQKRWAGKTQFHGISNFQGQCIQRGRYATVYLYFSGSMFFIVEENYTLKEFRRSITYDNKATAVKRWSTKKITWVETLKMQSLVPLNTNPP